MSTDPRGFPENRHVASIVHDLRNAVAVVRGHAQLLQRRLGRTDHPQAERLAGGLARIDQTTRRMTDLADELHPGAQPPPPAEDLTAGT